MASLFHKIFKTSFSSILPNSPEKIFPLGGTETIQIVLTRREKHFEFEGTVVKLVNTIHYGNLLYNNITIELDDSKNNMIFLTHFVLDSYRFYFVRFELIVLCNLLFFLNKRININFFCGKTQNKHTLIHLI